MSRVAKAIDDHCVTLSGVSAPALEDYRTLRYALEEKGVGNAFHVIAVTSPVVGDGKTTTAINLAGVLAHRREARVLLIDADLRRPSVAAVLGLAAAGQPGLADAIVDPQLTVADIALHLPETNLHVVTAGKPSRDPFELLRASRLALLLEEARQQFDVVVLDTSPLLLVPDTRILQGAVDGVLLVVAAHRTPRRLIAEALELVDRSKLLGTVFNRDDQPLTGYYGYSTYDGAA